MKQLKKLLILVLAVVLASSMAACKNGTDTGKNVLNIGIGPLSPLDPCASNGDAGYKLIEDVFDTLVRINNETKKIEPRAAKNWDISEDGLVYTFYLNEGMKFHDGTEVTADDVVYTINRVKTTPFTMSSCACIDKVEADGKYTVIVTLTHPFAPFLSLISQYFFGIVSKADVEAAGDTYGIKAIGSGPYVLKEFKSGSHLKLEAFKDYHMGEPPIKEVNVKFIPDTTSQVLAMQKGEVDFLWEIQQRDKPAFENSDKYTLGYYLVPNIDMIYMNTEVEGLNDKRVRQAFALALNYDDIMQYLCEGQGIIPDNHSFANLAGYPADAPKRELVNINKAKELLKEAGLPEGATFNIMVYDETLTNLAQIVQANLKQIGVEITISRVEYAVAGERASNGDFEMCVFGEPYAFPDTDGWLTPIFHSSSIGGRNYSRYNNPAFDALLDKARVSLDESERQSLYKESLEILLDDMPSIPLDIFECIIVSDAKLGGWANDETLYLYNWYWKDTE